MNKPTNQGAVIKITEEHIVVLYANGQFKNLPRKHHEIPMMGEIIQVKNEKKRQLNFYSMWKRSAAIASVILMVWIAFSLIQTQNSNFQPTYIVAIDINPSIELYMDKDFFVKEIKALNDDGKTIINSLDYEDKPLLNLVEEIMDQSLELGYLSLTNDGLITTALITNERTENKLASDIRSTIEQHLNTHHIQAEVTLTQEDMDTFTNAQQLNISVNKYVIYDRMNRQGFNIQVDEINNNSISSLLQRESKKNNKEVSLPEEQESKESKQQKSPTKNTPNQKTNIDRNPSQTKPEQTNEKIQPPQQKDQKQTIKKEDTASDPKSESKSPLPQRNVPEETEQAQTSDEQTNPQDEEAPQQQGAQEKEQEQKKQPQHQTIKEEKPKLPR